MKKLFCVFLVLAVFAGCKSDKDVLATYKNGKITRGDFHKWLESKRYPLDTILKNKDRQKDRLKRMAIELITIAKAKEEGFDRNEDFLQKVNASTEGLLTKRLYDVEIKDNAKFNEPVVRIKQIMLRVRDFKMDPAQKNKKVMFSPDELENAFKEAEAKAAEIIDKLGKGGKFEELVQQYSEDSSKRNEGDIGYITFDMMPADFSEPAFALKKGEFTRKPVRSSRGVFVLKAEDKKEITEKNIDKIIKDKNQAMRIKSMLMRDFAKKYMDNLLNAKDVKFFEENILSKNQSDVIFSIGDKEYTVADLETLIETKRFGAGQPENMKGEILDNYRKNAAKNFYNTEILKREALAKGIDKDPVYLEELQTRSDAILSREYTNNIISKESVVTDQEIKEEYEKNKDRAYTTTVTKGKNRVKQVQPLKDVRERIEKTIASRKRSQIIRSWEENILNEYEFKIDEKQLEGDKEAKKKNTNKVKPKK